jgi:molybdopterin-guanine dinucleotide biosynthesis protein A
MNAINRTAMTGVILAGGKNTRMGLNKAFLKIDGERLIDRIVRIFRELFPEILLITNEPLAHLDLDVKIASDIFPGKGPLGGIYTGLFYATYSNVFVSACDLPFLNPAFIQDMTGRMEGYDIVVPRTDAGYYPLHAIYSKRCMPPIRRLIEKDSLKVISFYKGMRTLILGPEVILPFYSHGNMFHNINTKRDVEGAPFSLVV